MKTIGLFLVLFSLPCFAQFLMIDRVERVAFYLLQEIRDDEVSEKNDLTQKEVQEALRFVHVGGLKTSELFSLKFKLLKSPEFFSLSQEQQEELTGILTTMYLLSFTMDEYRQKGMWCRFALSNTPNMETPIDSQAMVFLPESKDLPLYGLCWDKIQKDYLYRMNLDPRTLKQRE